MRFLADENCSRALIDALVQAGHDVLPAVTVGPGTTDEALARLAIDEARVVVTEDFDFGELAVRHGLPIPGVLLLGPTGPNLPTQCERALEAIGSLGVGLIDHLTVVAGAKIRRRKLR